MYQTLYRISKKKDLEDSILYFRIEWGIPISFSIQDRDGNTVIKQNIDWYLYSSYYKTYEEAIKKVQELRTIERLSKQPEIVDGWEVVDEVSFIVSA